MNIKKKNILLAGAAILAIGSASVASAQVVNVQFAGEYPAGTPGPAYTGQGALVTTGTDWNYFDVPEFGVGPNPTVSITDPSTLLTTNGLTTTDTVTLGNVESFNEKTYNGAALASGNNLLDSQADSVAAMGSATFTIGGLTAGNSYNLYLYGASGNVNQGTVFTIGLNSLTTTGNTGGGYAANTPPTGGWVSPGDYVEFTGVVANISGDISGSWITSGATSLQDGPFDGLQIQSESLSVPEPSVVILLGLGLLSLVALRRARRIS